MYELGQHLLKRLEKSIPLLLALIAVVCTVYFIKKDELHFALLIPAALCFIYWFIFRLDILFLILAFTVPASATLEMLHIHNPLGFEVALPSEPILIALLVVSVYKLIFYFDRFKTLLKHPVFLAILFYIATIVFTTITSTMHLVSLKFLLSRLWLMLPCLIFGFLMFKDKKNYYRFIALLSASASIVCLYTVIHLASKGFELQAAHFVMQPFYKDHTVYGASITLVGFLSFFSIKNKEISARMRFFFLMTTIIISVGIIFSYTRAAWISIVGAVLVYVVMRLRISFKLLMISGISLFLFLFTFSDQILSSLNKNDQDSSGDFTEHISSMSNISTDASNLERLNRWYCAVSLWQDHPIIGSGPGTYQFLYAPYQKAFTRSLISTNDGDGGNAHSEFLGAMSDSGIVGLLGIVVLLYITLRYAIRLYHKVDSETDRKTIMGITLALISYFMHGVLNNYLDAEKCAVPIWIGIAMLISIGIQHQKSLKESSNA